MTLKTSEQLAREVIDRHYGIGSDWEEPNQYGEEGFTRAQAESDIDADDIRLLIEEAVYADHEQIRAALTSGRAVPGIRSFAMPSVSSLLDAWEAFDGDDASTFTETWDSYLRGEDFPCPDCSDGLHRVTSGSCDACGDKNRN